MAGRGLRGEPGRGSGSRRGRYDPGDEERARDGRGRTAESPTQIPRPGWTDILWRTWQQIGEDHVSLIAAGVAFYALLALFPAITALIAFWGLFADPQQVEQQFSMLNTMLPQEAASIIQDQAHKVAASDSGTGLAALIGIAIAIYGASKGMTSLMDGLNIVYDEEEKRGFIKLTVAALTLTIGAVIAVIVAIGIILVLPIVLRFLGLGAVSEIAVTVLRWPLLFFGVVFGLAVLYRFAPSRAGARWQWVSWGAAIAALLWVIASIGFAIYVRNFGSYNETYGALGAVIILLFWFWLSAYIVLAGAELNSEMEHQTAVDTTTGEPRPRGSRKAYVADTVGRAQT